MKILLLLSVLLSVPAAQASDEIIHPYRSVRSVGMGGVLYSTGLYEENFYGNPARVNANPKVKIAVFDPTFEINSKMPDTISKLTGDGDKVQKISSTAGNNNHGRLEFSMPGVYIPPDGDFKFGFGAAVLTSIQANVDLHNDFEGELQAIVDTGPALTVGRKLLEKDELSVGLTTHVAYRLAPKSDFSVAQALNGTEILSSKDAGNGMHLDFDVGGTYLIPFEFENFTFEGVASINNILGGKYSNLGGDFTKSGTLPLAQPRTYNFGGAAHRRELGPLTDFVAALEMSDIGNNPNGGLFRTIHLGGEAHWSVLAGRLGINQGYLCAGFGVDLRFVQLDLATYGEELTLNPGGMEDRRYAIRLAFQI